MELMWTDSTEMYADCMDRLSNGMYVQICLDAVYCISIDFEFMWEITTGPTMNLTLSDPDQFQSMWLFHPFTAKISEL